ncbi:MAG: phosphoribosylglycinamide formyltransferase [Clostridiaceae bacterium]|nr:phosphoribosylglycinamide formyltransferase [Clostridiaceae bacterium]
MKKIAVLVSGGGTNLQALIDAQNDGRIKSGKISLVISSNPSAYALKRAGMAGIPSVVIEKGKLSRDEYTKKLTQCLTGHEIDLVVLAGFMHILGPEIIKEYQNKIINVHPSLIPSFCGEGYYGIHVHEATLEYGVKVTGATVHFVNEIPDGGPIILQKAVEILDTDTPEPLQLRVMKEAEHIILPKAVELFCADKLEVRGRIVKIRKD